MPPWTSTTPWVEQVTAALPRPVRRLVLRVAAGPAPLSCSGATHHRQSGCMHYDVPRSSGTISNHPCQGRAGSYTKQRRCQELPAATPNGIEYSTSRTRSAGVTPRYEGLERSAHRSRRSYSHPEPISRSVLRDRSSSPMAEPSAFARSRPPQGAHDAPAPRMPPPRPTQPLVGHSQSLSGTHATALPAQPLAIQQLSPSGVHFDTGPGELFDGLAARTTGATLQRPARLLAARPPRAAPGTPTHARPQTPAAPSSRFQVHRAKPGPNPGRPAPARPAAPTLHTRGADRAAQTHGPPPATLLGEAGLCPSAWHRK